MVDRVHIGNIAVDRITFDEALAGCQQLVEQRRGGCVFTPNVDHVVVAEDDPSFREAYAVADLVLADGMPIVWASRFLGRPLPGKISGSDLVMPLMRRAAQRGWRIYLLGGAPGVAERARYVMEADISGLSIVGTSSPDVDTTSRRGYEKIISDIRAAEPDLVLVALGAPKQEVFIQQIYRDLSSVVFVGVGGSLDFIAGVQKRAPKWMSEHGLEWLFRLLHDPRRLWKRYLVRDPRFIVVLCRTLLHAGTK